MPVRGRLLLPASVFPNFQICTFLQCFGSLLLGWWFNTWEEWHGQRERSRCPMSHVKKWSLSACTEIWHFPLCLIKKRIAFYLLKLWGYGTHMSDSLWEQVWSFWALSPGHRLVRKCLHPLSHPAIPVCSWGLVSLGSPWSPGSPLWALRDRDDRYVLPGLKKKNKKQIMWQKGHDSHSL